MKRAVKLLLEFHYPTDSDEEAQDIAHAFVEVTNHTLKQMALKLTIDDVVEIINQPQE